MGDIIDDPIPSHGPVTNRDAIVTWVKVNRPQHPAVERWRITPTSCACGGNIAWMRQRSSGAWEMVGCVCHSTPPELVGRVLGEVPTPYDKEP